MFGTKENSELFRLLLKTLVSDEEPTSVEDAPSATLRSAPGGKNNLLKCFWFQVDGAEFCLSLLFNNLGSASLMLCFDLLPHILEFYDG